MNSQLLHELNGGFILTDFNPIDKDGNKMVHPSHTSQKIWADWIKNLPLAPLPDGIPCSHPGCLNHVTHPCEGCGRIAGISSLI